MRRVFSATFRRPKEPARCIKESLEEREVAVYIHYPFCRSTCFSCPYARILWEGELASRYVDALVEEIRMYGDLLADLDLRIADVHVGGGTPSLMDGEDYRRIMEALRSSFRLDAQIAIEANPNDLDEDKVTNLLEAGVNEVSLGVQSFHDPTLKKLGRIHRAKDSVRAIELLRKQGLEYLNIDMMYAVPGQKLQEWEQDLTAASQQDVDEITCYPTLITPQALFYEKVRKGELEPQPSKREFKRMIMATYHILEPAGFDSVEIYGFSRKEGWKYATVNYELEGSLLAFGSGAVGFTGRYEYVNTHSPVEYVRAVKKGRFPVAGGRWVEERERIARYVACRLFVCKKLRYSDFERTFGIPFGEAIGKTKLGLALLLLRLAGTLKKRADGLELTKRGLLSAHMMCWAFVTNFPCRVAEEFMKEPWPESVTVP